MRQYRPLCAQRPQRGSAMVEFTVVGPLITLLGLALLQYGLLFFNKNQINHASFMAARAGTMAHAQLPDIRQAYLRAMVPLYGGGTSSAELAGAKARAAADLAANLRIDLLNPTRESFDDWSEPHLEKKYGARAIPNAGQAYRDRNIGSRSGQSVQDANLIQIRITHGYELKIPLVRGIFKHYLSWLDDGSDPFHTELIARGRLPVVAQATLHMQSDPVESDATVSMAGPDGGNGGAQGPGQPGTDDPGEPPDCETVGCSTAGPRPEPGNQGGGTGKDDNEDSNSQGGDGPGQGGADGTDDGSPPDDGDKQDGKDDGKGKDDGNEGSCQGNGCPSCTGK